MDLTLMIGQMELHIPRSAAVLRQQLDGFQVDAVFVAAEEPIQTLWQKIGVALFQQCIPRRSRDWQEWHAPVVAVWMGITPDAARKRFANARGT